MDSNLQNVDLLQLFRTVQEQQQQLTLLADKVQQHDNLLARLDLLEKENDELKKVIQAKDLAIEKLQGLVSSHNNSSSDPVRGGKGTSNQGSPKPKITANIATDTTNISMDTTATVTGQKSFLSIASAAANRPDPAVVSKNLAKKRRIAGRMFKSTAAKGPRGYRYVYLGRSGKLLRSDIRSTLRDVGVDLGRILDISFPGPDVFGILLHVQYVEEFLDLVTKCEAEIVTDFDALNPDNIADPKFATLSGPERHALIYQFNETRCLQTLSFLHPLNVSAVGKYFSEQGWIGQDDLSAAIAAAAKRYAVKEPQRAKFFFRRRLASDSDEELSEGEDSTSVTDENGSDMEH